MERTKLRTQSLMTQMVPVNLSANETNGACVFPSRPRPASRSNRPDTYLRLPISSKFPLAKRSRSIHMGQLETIRLNPAADCRTAAATRSGNGMNGPVVMGRVRLDHSEIEVFWQQRANVMALTGDAICRRYVLAMLPNLRNSSTIEAGHPVDVG